VDVTPSTATVSGASWLVAVDPLKVVVLGRAAYARLEILGGDLVGFGVVARHRVLLLSRIPVGHGPVK
jgi:hypothetical protein